MIHEGPQISVKVIAVNGSVALGTGNGDLIPIDTRDYNPGGGWLTCPRSIKQFATQLSQRLVQQGMPHPLLHFDIWKSENGRYTQRFVDPLQDLATVEWSLTTSPSWVIPQLTIFDNHRHEMSAIRAEIERQGMTARFMADSPGYVRESISPQSVFISCHFRLLGGEVELEICPSHTNSYQRQPLLWKRAIDPNCKIMIPKVNDTVSLPLSEYVYAHTRGETVARYIFIQQKK